MIVISLLNEKGGVGKTTLATTAAARLASLGYNTLLIDADSQGHATLSLRQKRRDGLYALLMNNASFNAVLQGIPPDYYNGEEETVLLWLLPSSSGTAQLVKDLDPRLLKQRLGEVASIFDLVIIDTSPTISDLHLSFYLASDYIVYPTECTFMSLQGLLRSVQHLERARELYGPKGYPVAEMMGIVPSKFSGRESVHSENYGWLKGKYGNEMVFTPIRRRTDWEKASQMRMPIFVLEPSSKASNEAQRFVDELLSRVKELA